MVSCDSPLTYIASLNSHRRHLTSAQRSVIAVKHTEMLQHGSNRYENKVETQDCVSKTIDEVAKVVGVSSRTVDNVKQALQIAPEKADAMISGEISVSVYPRFSAHACAMMVSSFGCGRR